MAYYYRVEAEGEHVDLVIFQMLPWGPHPAFTLCLTTEQAYEMSNHLTDTAEEIDRAAKVPSDLQVRKAGELWSYSCAAHPNEGLGLWHEQVQAFAAACEHYTTHHQEQ